MAIPVNADVTALVETDPQNDFLSEKGAFWDAVKQSVIENNTIENIESMLLAAKEGGVPVFISPHYYFPWDHRWKFAGTIEKAMHDVGMYDRTDPLDLTLPMICEPPSTSSRSIGLGKAQNHSHIGIAARPALARRSKAAPPSTTSIMALTPTAENCCTTARPIDF